MKGLQNRLETTEDDYEVCQKTVGSETLGKYSGRDTFLAKVQMRAEFGKAHREGEN